jgi:hypothetical protein
MMIQTIPDCFRIAKLFVLTVAQDFKPKFEGKEIKKRQWLSIQTN